MIEQRIFCDRCHRLIDAGRTLLHVETGPLRERRPTCDLCPACLEEWVRWLSAGASTPEPIATT
jgi:hypothetical protein